MTSESNVVIEKKVKRPLAISTIKMYARKLQQAEKLGIKLDGTLKADEIFSILKNVNPAYDMSTILGFLNAFQNKLRNQNNNNDKIINLINAFEGYIKTINEQKKEMANKRQLTGKQVINYISYDTILLIYREIEKIQNVSKSTYKNFLILSLYIKFNGIRRIHDYATMKIVNLYEETLKRGNYYVKKCGLFVFEDYKTWNTYKRQIFDVNDELKNIIDIYIDRYNIIGYLLSNKSKEDIDRSKWLANKLCNIFKVYIDKDIRCNILRHAFVSDFLKIDRTPDEKEKMSFRMGHSIPTQMVYEKIDTKNIDNIEIRTNKDIDSLAKWSYKDDILTIDEVNEINNKEKVLLRRKRNKRYQTKKNNK